MAFFQVKQLRHKATGVIFNATPPLEASPDYEVYAEAHMVEDQPAEPAPEAAPKRRGRPPKVDNGATDDGDT